MDASTTTRHLLDLCRRADRTGLWVYSGFLTPAEQLDFQRDPEAARFSWRLEGGHAVAERRILVAGEEDRIGYAPAPPIRVVAVKPASLKFAEELGHRDFLGAILGLGIERSLIGDLLVREKTAWFYCLDSAVDFVTGGLTQVRRTTVTARVMEADAPELQPQYQPLRVNVASERLDALVAAFAGCSRGQAADLLSAEKVFVNGRPVADKSARLREGDIVSIRGVGKAVYDGIEHETRKNRLWVSLRKYI